MPSAIGERTELWSQQNSTGLWQVLICFALCHFLAPEVQNADEGEQAAGGVVVDVRLALKAFLQARARLRCGCHGAPYRWFQSGWGRQGFDRVKVAFADLESSP